MTNLSDQEKIQRRVKERFFWFRVGSFLLIASVILFVIFMISSFFGLPFYLFNQLLNLSLFGIFIGSIFMLFLGRIGWSKFLVIDFALNRLSILFILGGFILEINQALFKKALYFQILPNNGYGMVVIGIILLLLGIYFQPDR